MVEAYILVQTEVGKASDVAGLIAGPIDLRIREAKSIRVKISRNRADVALSPAPLIDKPLIDVDQPHRNRRDADQNRRANMSIFYSRNHSELQRVHQSRLDKPLRQSQSSTGV